MWIQRLYVVLHRQKQKIYLKINLLPSFEAIAPRDSGNRFAKLDNAVDMHQQFLSPAFLSPKRKMQSIRRQDIRSQSIVGR